MPVVVWADAALNIQVTGLFRDRAVVEINGNRQLLQVGESSKEGIKLIAANSNVATLLVNGKQQQFPLGMQIKSEFAAAEAGPIVSLWPTNGMYLTSGSINDFSVDFLVDTGASAIAMNAPTAERLGLDYLQAPRVRIRTASGQTTGYQVTLDKVQLGEITRHQVVAVVVDGNSPEVALLGMSFLKNLDLQRQGERLDLIQKF
ncbi:clan AA aspartic protease, TIGR02281 family [Methylophaga frappieri]|jgi:aspartyl protease family protein|uniref:Clan AA aspartic protease, TIGR02281 family n=2 Tax=Methylophaga frappieri (strain ATCC BAA-2434 / DSM 25690 / JAM7) TaxID=754477 RepID=I1YG09_METFJ|nr:clan AA aspartic protease, TIGR02281 family [Methylophaga frappieri]